MLALSFQSHSTPSCSTSHTLSRTTQRFTCIVTGRPNGAVLSQSAGRGRPPAQASPLPRRPLAARRAHPLPSCPYQALCVRFVTHPSSLAQVPRLQDAPPLLEPAGPTRGQASPSGGSPPGQEDPNNELSPCPLPEDLLWPPTPPGSGLTPCQDRPQAPLPQGSSHILPPGLHHTEPPI